MKRIVMLAAGMGAVAAVAAGATVAEAGKRLFGSPRLGTNGQTCVGCHPDGNGASVQGKSEDEAVLLINRCIEKTLDGKPLAPGSAEMRGLLEYLGSLPADAPAEEE